MVSRKRICVLAALGTAMSIGLWIFADGVDRHAESEREFGVARQSGAVDRAIDGVGVINQEGAGFEHVSQRRGQGAPQVDLDIAAPTGERVDGGSPQKISKAPLEIGSPKLVAPRGDQYWLQYYHKYGDLDPNEYQRLALLQIKFIHELQALYAQDLVSAGKYYPWDDHVESERDAELRSRVSGPNASLVGGGMKAGIGRYYVVFFEGRLSRYI